jgi:hypothetical protein
MGEVVWGSILCAPRESQYKQPQQPRRLICTQMRYSLDLPGLGHAAFNLEASDLGAGCVPRLVWAAPSANRPRTYVWRLLGSPIR